MRINIVGTSGCGKSTVGKHIAERLNIPYIQLDELHWKKSVNRPFMSLKTSSNQR